MLLGIFSNIPCTQYNHCRYETPADGSQVAQGKDAVIAGKGEVQVAGGCEWRAGGEIPQHWCGLLAQASGDNFVGNCEWRAGGEIPQLGCGLLEEDAVDDVASTCEWRAGGEIPQLGCGLLVEDAIDDVASKCEWRAGGEIPQHECGPTEEDAVDEGPWHFLLPEDCANTSVTCKRVWKCVAEWTPIGEKYIASVECEAWQEPAKRSVDAKEASVPEELDTDDLLLSVSQVLSVIEAVVSQIKETREGKKLSAEWYDQLVQMLKQKYEDRQTSMYPRSHSKELAELIGHLCGEAACEVSSSSGAN